VNPFKLNQVLQLAIHSAGEPTLFRLLWTSDRANRVWLIEIPRARTQYCKGHFSVELSTFEEMYQRNEIVSVDISPMPTWTMSDSDIKARYPGKDGNCPAIHTRDMKWGWVKDLVMQHSLADIFEGGLITSWVSESAANLGVTPNKLYDAVNRYFAGGQEKNALLPNWCLSGAKGKPRVQKRKLGRPDKEAAANTNVREGYFLDEEDKRKLQHGWTHYLPGKSVSDAFIEMSGVFYNSGVKIEDGKYVPILLPARERPTIEQFRRWGPGNDAEKAAWRIKLAPKEWINNYKGISGSAKDGIVAIGVQAFCDTTTNDAHLVSTSSRLRPVGTLNRLMIHEAKSELIMGLHCGFEPPSTRTFLLAVANAASSKVDFYARFGLTIADDQAPALAVKTYLGDNGEYRSIEAKQALARFGAHVEMAASGEARRKGPIEGLHHVFHSRLDKTLDGATHGRPRKRGEVSPILKGCLNYYEYMHELLKEVLYYNNEEIVPHLLTTEMRRENVHPTRIEIYRWMITKGYVSDFTPDLSILRAHFYPELPAKLTESGIYLLREDCGNQEVMVPGLRYMSRYLIETGMLSNARMRGTRKVTVRGIPEDPSKMWLVTDAGLIELECITDDPILVGRGTIHDCLAMQDDDKVRGIQARDYVEQRRSDILVARQETTRRARTEKAAEIAALPAKPSKVSLTSGIEENRKAEMEMLSVAQPERRSLRDAEEGITDAKPPVFNAPDSSAHEDDPAVRAIMQYLEQEGAA
jgi:hypothetical protein